MKNFVEEIIEKYGTRDPFEIARKLDILIVAEPLGEVESYFSPSLIHINNRFPEWYQNFLVACQLYNALRPSDDLGFVFHSRYEFSREAIRFAVRLITDIDRVNKEGFDSVARSYGIPENEIPRLRNRFNKIWKEDE